MRVIKARRNRLLAVVAGCAILVFILHTLLFELTVNCTSSKVPIQGKDTKSNIREFQGYVLGGLGNNDTGKLVTLPPGDCNKSDSDTGKISESKIKATVQTDDVMSNISFSDLLHVIEIKSLDDRSFSEWTQTYMHTKHKNSLQMPPFDVIGDTVCDNDTEMVIIVPAHPYKGFMRELIRQTWASSLYGVDIPKMRTTSMRTKLVFTFGTSQLPERLKMAINQEASRYNDVVSADFVDSYRNLSLKMMVGLKWASEYCGSAKYVMKVDIDTFVNLPLLSRFVMEISDKIPRFILGHRHTWPKHPVLRSGRWKVDNEDYPFESFPPYLLGHSYVITGELVPLLVYASEHLPLIPTEDSYITGVLARVVRAPRLHYEGFASVFKNVEPCKIVYNYEISVTRMTESRLILLWRDQLNNVCSDTEPPERLDYPRSEHDDTKHKQKRKDEDVQHQVVPIKQDDQVRGNESTVETEINLKKWDFS